MKRVLFFGIFDPEYARTRILTEGFEALGYQVVSCRVDPREKRGWRKYLALWRQGRKLRHETFDQVLVLFPGHTLVWLARILFGKRIIFDAFVSLHDSNVYDRAQYRAHSLKAWRDRFLDWWSCALAQTVLVDTESHRHYFLEKIGVPESKGVVVPVGASRPWFEAKKNVRENSAPSKVGFYGTYIPLHGIETIVRAAALLTNEPIRFEIIGSGQETGRIQKIVQELGGLPNVAFISRLSRDELIKAMNASDICLGIFGTTEKASRVIPNKVYECAALGKPIVTADTPGIHEAFSEKEMVLIPPGDPEALAAAIRTLAADPAHRRRLADAARNRMEERYTPEHIVGDLIKSLEDAFRHETS